MEMENEGSAIKALGSLFKLTEIYIWEDGSTDTREICLSPESTSKADQDYEDNSSSVTAFTCDFDEIREDVELIKQMDALGLPLSFQSGKKHTENNKVKKGKRKGTRLKLSSGDKEALECTKVSEVEIVSPNALRDNSTSSICCMSMPGKSESCYCDVAVGTCGSRSSADEESTSSTFISSGDVFGRASFNLSDNGHELDDVTLSDVVSNGEDKKAISLSNLDGPPSPSCQLMDAYADHNEKQLGRSLESKCLCDSFTVDCHHEDSTRFCSEENIEQAGASETVELPHSSELLKCNGIESHGDNGSLGDWRVYWDTYYMRNYFYNIQTGTTTWDPPAGVFDGSNEEIVEMTENGVSCSTCVDGVLVDVATYAVPENSSFEFQGKVQGLSPSCHDEITPCVSFDAQHNSGSLTSMITDQVIEDDNMQMENGDPATDKLHTLLEHGLKKKKKKARKTLAHRKSSNAAEDLQCQEILEDFSASIGRYWRQRYLLFTRYDSGIRMDEEGWFSVTPEPIAAHQALRCASDVIIDCFTGVGGNAIQFAQRCKHVIAIDVDPKKIDYARHNASIYGVEDRIDFIVGDFFVLAPKLKADTVFLSPPWGGPDYAKVKTYDIMTMLRPQSGFSLFNTAKKVACRVVMFLPRNVDFHQLKELTLSSDHPWSLEVEKNYLHGQLKSVTAYFSETTVEGT